MLIVAGVNVWPSAIKDVVTSLHPRTTGAVQILLGAAAARRAAAAHPGRVRPRRHDLQGLKDEVEGCSATS